MWAIIWPTLVSLFILFAGKRPNLREGGTLLGSVILFITVLSMTPVILKSGPIQFVGFALFPGIAFAFRVDALGLIFATTSSCLWILEL